MAARKVARGALAPWYDIPSAEYRARGGPAGLLAVCALAGALTGRHVTYIEHHAGARLLLTAWLLGSLVVCAQWVISFRDRPVRATRRQRAQLGRMVVRVVIPVRNEDPRILDRTVWAAVNSSRPPQEVWVIENGNTVDYTTLRGHWEGCHGPVRVIWAASSPGKKTAQAAAFAASGAAAIATVDSDSALEHRALERALERFADPRVQSVAGMELAWNARVNWLTRTVNARSMLFQVVACGAQAVFGQTLVNRGPFAVYRADLLAETLPAYLGETFLGRPVHLGDDAALALFATGRGRAVQQPDAVCYSMFPERLSQHRRQWIRWMRGSTIRNCWRIKYLPVTSYGWWFTLLNMYLFLVALAVPFAIALSWPGSEGVALWIAGAVTPWAYLPGLRMLVMRRSDETWWHRLVNLACYPASIMWMLVFLRWLRVYGIVTCLRQGWNTRQHVEDLTTGAVK